MKKHSYNKTLIIVATILGISIFGTVGLNNYQKEQQKIRSENKIEDCIRFASLKFEEDWIAACKLRGLDYKCDLPGEIERTLKNDYDKERGICTKIY